MIDVSAGIKHAFRAVVHKDAYEAGGVHTLDGAVYGREQQGVCEVSQLVEHDFHHELAASLGMLAGFKPNGGHIFWQVPERGTLATGMRAAIDGAEVKGCGQCVSSIVSWLLQQRLARFFMNLRNMRLR